MKESNTSSPFNVLKTTQLCSLHFHERICVREKPYESVQYNEAFVHFYILHHYDTIHTVEKFCECQQCCKVCMLWDTLSYNKNQTPGQLKRQEIFVVNLLLINQDKKNVFRRLTIDFCLYFQSVTYTTTFLKVFISSGIAFGKFWFTYAYDHVIFK